MPDFNPEEAYAEQEDVFFDDGREIELLHSIYSRTDINSLRGSPSAILAAIDEFGRKSKYLMNVGKDKGAIVSQLIAQKSPHTMVELGGYVGYSTILFSEAMRKAGGKQYFCLERNPEFAAVILSLVDLAGLRDVVTVVVGSSSDSLYRLHSEGSIKNIDVLFLDHYKPAYLTDLKICEELELITPGSVLAADNVIKPGNPPYLAYVRSSVAEKKQVYGQSHVINGFEERTTKQYEKREGSEQLKDIRGNPGLIYESTLVHSFEPTGVPDGVEITKCCGQED